MTAYWLKLGDVPPAAAWPPLEALAVRSAADPALPFVDPDDFLYAARVERAGLPELHVFRHVLTGGYLGVDDLGGLWRFIGRGSGAEGYTQVGSLAEALSRAGLDRAERLALRTRRGPRRPSAPDRPLGPDEAGPALSLVGDDGTSADEDELWSA
jgi:hypothetical protein